MASTNMHRPMPTTINCTPAACLPSDVAVAHQCLFLPSALPTSWCSVQKRRLQLDVNKTKRYINRFKTQPHQTCRVDLSLAIGLDTIKMFISDVVRDLGVLLYLLLKP